MNWWRGTAANASDQTGGQFAAGGQTVKQPPVQRGDVAHFSSWFLSWSDPPPPCWPPSCRGAVREQPDHGWVEVPAAADARSDMSPLSADDQLWHALPQDLRRGHDELRFDVDRGISFQLLPNPAHSRQRNSPRAQHYLPWLNAAWGVTLDGGRWQLGPIAGLNR
jgi:hypothetical protein